LAQTPSKISKAHQRVSYANWLESHAQKHQQIISKLLKKNYTKDQIVNYFRYENISKQEPNFCPLFQQKTKCHDIEELNCYFCGCPHFRFYDIPQDNIHSFCAIKSPDGEQKCYNNVYHQDCSHCIIPHKKQYILQNYTHNWLNKMKLCRKET